VGEQFDTACGLDMNIQSNVEHHKRDESEEAKFQETCEEDIAPTILKFNDDILS